MKKEQILSFIIPSFIILSFIFSFLNCENKISSNKKPIGIKSNLNLINNGLDNSFVGEKNMHILFGNFSKEKLLYAINESSKFKNKGEALLRASDFFINVAYKSNSNYGTPKILDKEGNVITEKREEKLTLDLSGLDCVTFVENTMGLIYSKDINDYFKTLQKIKYYNSKVSYESRNHYMSNWLEYNAKNGYLDVVTEDLGVPVTREMTRTMNVLSEIKPFEIKFKYIGKEFVEKAETKLKNGDIILFVSSNVNVDYAHLGIINNRKGNCLLRHAKYKKHVLDDLPVSEYIRNKSFPGIVVARLK